MRTKKKMYLVEMRMHCVDSCVVEAGSAEEALKLSKDEIDWSHNTLRSFPLTARLAKIK